MLPEQLTKILQSHKLWLTSGGKEGERANLEGVELEWAELQGADLQNAILNGAAFKNANLIAANLQGAQLRGASFDGAKLQAADLRTPFLNKAEFKNAILTKTNLQGARLPGANFDGANLRRADLRNALLEEAVFKGAELIETNLQGGQLRRASFDGAILRRANLREADLENANLENTNFLLSSQLAGSNVAGAKLPAAIAEFKGLETIAEATSNAQKLFVAMLGGCLYSWLTIGTTKDAALLTNSASSPLPIIGTELPIVGFYTVAPIVLLAMYFYFHLNMQRLWEALADLPAVFPDGRSLDKRADPWLLNGLVSAHFVRLRSQRPSLSRVQQWLSILLAWWVVPVTLFAFWGRFLPRHDWFGTGLHIGLLAAAVGFGWMSYRLARATLRGIPRTSFRWAQAWHDVRTYKRAAGIAVIFVIAVIFYIAAFGAIEGIPSTTWAFKSEPYRLQTLVPRMLGHIGFSAFASLSEEDVSTKPANWTGKTEEYPLVKGARLRRSNMQCANATSAFFVNADLSDANLHGADLSLADLTNANLHSANLSHANLSGADIKGGDLGWADLNGANLSKVNFSKAKLISADFRKANLAKADLSGADLRFAVFSGTKDESGANLRGANLSGANLYEAFLQMADFSDANLRGTNLSGANVSMARLSGTDLSGVDLTNVRGLTKSQIEEAQKDEKTLLPSGLAP